jgi:hypothetical protein
MRRLPDEVWIDAFSARCVCPVHGEQGPEVEYLAGVAPCGCVWTSDADGRMLASSAALPGQPGESELAGVLRNGSENAG